VLQLRDNATDVFCFRRNQLVYTNKYAVLSQEEPRDAAVNFNAYRILQRHRAVSLPQHGFVVGLCLQTTVNHLSKSDKY